MLNRCKIILIIFLLLQFGCLSSKIPKKTFHQKLNALNIIYHDSLRAQHGRLTSKFIYKWGDRYWDLVTEEPNNTLAPVAAKKAFDIYKKLKNSNLYEKKLNDLSINDRAMSRILPYWNDALWNGEDYTPATHPYPQKLQIIARKSKSIPVQIAAHYYLAQWYTKFKYYRLARNQLNVLDLSYQIYDSDPRYGNGIKKMRAAADYFSAGKQMPAFSIKMLDGSTLTKKDLENKITFFYFYGSHCGSCVHMYPKITQLYKTYKQKGFMVIGFALDWQVNYGFNTPKEFGNFAKEYSIVWPQAIKYDLWDKLQVQALSTGYLINQQGKIVRISRSETVSNAMGKFEHTSLKEAVVMLMEK